MYKLYLPILGYIFGVIIIWFIYLY